MDESHVIKESGDEDIVALGSNDTSAAATKYVPDDVTGISGCEDPNVWERMSNEHVRQSDVGNGEDEQEESTPVATERLETEHHFAVIEALLQAAVEDESDEDLEGLYRARNQLLQSIETDVFHIIEHAAFDEAERTLELWLDAMESQPRKADDRRVQQECHVCLEAVKLDKRPCCGLPVCQDCMKKYVDTQLQAGVVRIGCPNLTCSRVMLHEEIRELLRSTPGLRNRYDRRLVDVNADPRRKTCPRCSRITEVETAQLMDRKATKHGVMVVCPDCQLSWCFTCQAPWHEGVTCARNRAGDELLKRWARQKTPSACNAQRCPKCKVYIQRISGCDHMKCNQCKTKFCYRCGGRRFKLKVFGYRLEDHDKKYSIIGCNDKYNDNKRRRRMFARAGIFGAKVVGGLVAVPVMCGVALAALTVAAPAYGVYRLVKRVRRPSTEFPRYDADIDSDFFDEFDVTDIFDDPPTPPLPPRLPSSLFLPEYVLLEDIASEEPVRPPLLPPRQPICRSPTLPQRPRRPAAPPPSLDDTIKNDLYESTASPESVIEEITHL